MKNYQETSSSLLIDLLFRPAKLVIQKLKTIVKDIEAKITLTNNWLTLLNAIRKQRLTEGLALDSASSFKKEQWTLLNYISPVTFEYVSAELIKWLSLNINDEIKNRTFLSTIMSILEKLHQPSINDFKSISLMGSCNLEIGFRILFSSETEKLNLIQHQFTELTLLKEQHNLLNEPFLEMIDALQKSRPVAVTSTMILIKCNDWEQAQIINEWRLIPAAYARLTELLFQKRWLIYAVDKKTLINMRSLFMKLKKENSLAKKREKIVIKPDNENEDPALTIVRKIFSETEED